MVSLEKEITVARFNRVPRVIYAIQSSNGSRTHYLTVDTAYLKMEAIARQLRAIAALAEEVLHDLDVRPVVLVTDAGARYELLTLTIDY